MPFTNTANDPELGIFSDGISEPPQQPLKTAGNESHRQQFQLKYRGKVDPQEVANTLGVQAVVAGRIVRFGDTLQISVELVNARNGTDVGEQYKRKAADFQAVPGEIARTIAEKVRVKLTGAQEQRLIKLATENPEAYRLFLNGEFYGKKGRIEDGRKALDYYNQAIALDPNFALAYVGVAEEYEDFAVDSLSDPKDALARAKAALRKALELDDTVAWAHTMLGIIKGEEWDWAGAEIEFKRALELNPNLARAHGRYASYLTLMGRHTEALTEIKRAQELDPLSINLRFGEGAALYNAHRFDGLCNCSTRLRCSRTSASRITIWAWHTQ